MSQLTTNNLTNTLGIYAQGALDQYIANAPSRHLFLKDFDTEVANGGQFVTTRLPNTTFGGVNDLTTGWNDVSASVNNITIPLKIGSFSEKFDELQFSTLTDTNIRNWFMPQMAKQLANSTVLNVINNITSSVFTNTITVASSSLFTLSGSNSVNSIATTLSNLEIPEEDRYMIVTPNVYSAIVNQMLPVYFSGDGEAVRQNKVNDILGFELNKYARLYNASLPQGGDKYTGNDKLIGFAGVEQGLVAVQRAPVEINYGTTWSANAVDKSSGVSIQVRLMYDQSQPVWRMAVINIFGSAAGNPSALIPILTQSI